MYIIIFVVYIALLLLLLLVYDRLGRLPRYDALGTYDATRVRERYSLESMVWLTRPSQ